MKSKRRDAFAPKEFPATLFRPPDKRGDDWPDEPDVRRAVTYFRDFIGQDEWKKRRNAAANRLYAASLGRVDETDRGRYFDESDVFGWYLFLAEAFIDHVWNFEPTFGSRVVPVFKAIGRGLDLLLSVDGVEERARRLVSSERRQPNGGLFELLVASAYRSSGARVKFVPERRGLSRTYDMDVEIGSRSFAVECKRLETSQYGERERAAMRELWRPSATGFSQNEQSAFCDVHFRIPIDRVPPAYLTEKSLEWLRSDMPSLLWSDDMSYGAMGELDLDPLREVLDDHHVLASSSRMLELLSGRYVRHANYIQLSRLKLAENPRYVHECDLAVLLRWESASPEAIDAKARDITTKLSEASDQLPAGRPGIVHIGFEAVEGDDVERARHRKIIERAQAFDPRGKPLEYVYCHYFVPESPPDQAWAFDETLQWVGIAPTGPHPLGETMLILPAEGVREGPHWR
ncbi:MULTISPECIES: transposase [Bradyrhizobium]|uniref:Transposase n=2 Tax=Pseudomonadota TaxID=1224 RepID=A0A5P6PEU8_9BRAD|nr:MULTISPECIES: transposase [Bradyrhizobium]MBJ7404542.1 transposase [Bradyrhizobium sp.]MCS3726122.1 hypothetical protein [Bradyrhizobium betae]QFI76796.1 transposase [Bradyrhizobium betae]